MLVSTQMKEVLKALEVTMQERERMFMEVEEQLFASTFLPIAMQNEIQQKLFQLKIKNEKAVGEWIRKIKKIEQKMLKLV